MSYSKKNNWPALFGSFLVVILVGLSIFKDYGISLDEPAQRIIGIANVNYVANIFNIEAITNHAHFSNFTNDSLLQLEDRHYGVIFEFPAALLELLFDAKNEASIYYARHLLTFVYFLIGLFSIYTIASIRYHSWKISLLACAIIIFSPRIFADAFYNSKDIVFLSTYALATYSLIKFFLRPSWCSAISHSLFSAIAIDTRLIGFIFPALTLLLFLVRGKNRKFAAQQVPILLFSYLFFCVIFIVSLWPYLWSNPFGHLLEAFSFISRHPHSPTITFFGNLFDTSHLPWYYIPAWIVISTPPLYIGLFLIGLFSILLSLHTLKWDAIFEGESLIDVIFLALLFGPIVAVALSHTPLYNGWRHLYFIYPFLALIGVRGFQVLLKYAKYTPLIGFVFLIGLSANFIFIGAWMINNHPLQNLYFNFFAGNNWSSSFETDYWGLANKKALDKILMLDNEEKISIWPGSNSKFKSGEPTVFTDQLLLKSQQIRQKITSPLNMEDAKYIIASKYGSYSEEYLSNHGRFRKIDSVKVDGSTILSIFEQYFSADLLPSKKNSKILFGKESPGIFYLAKNNDPPINWENWSSSEWHTPENWGSWAKGESASIELECPKEKVNELILRMRAFINQSSPSQSVKILVNDKLKNSFKFVNSASNTISINIANDCDISKRLTINFQNLKPISPKELGLSVDNRKISVGLESAEFR